MRVFPRYLVSRLIVFALPLLVAAGCGHDSTAPTPQTGAIEITVMTTSSIGQVDTTQYQVSVDNGAWQPVGVPTRVRIGSLTRARHYVMLAGLAANCGTTSDNPVVFDLDPELGTLLLTFTVDCAPPHPDPWGY
jgi:hypothetical protein